MQVLRLISFIFLAVSALFFGVGAIGLLGNVIEPEPYQVRAAIALCWAGTSGGILASITIAFPGRKYKITKLLLVIGVIVIWPWSMSLIYTAFVPPTDKNGNRPDDVVRNFVAWAEAGNYEPARKLWYGPSERLSPMKFEDYCERFKTIGLKNCKINGAGRGKSGYWTVRIDWEEGGEKKHYFQYLKIVDGEWKMYRGHAW